MENRLREIRIQHDLTQKYVARQVGIHYNTYMAIENGRLCQYDVIATLADFYGVSMDYILMRTDVPGVAGPDNDNLKSLLTQKFGTEIMGIAETILALGGDEQ